MEEFDEHCGSDFHYGHLLLTNRNRFIDSLQRPPANNRVSLSCVDTDHAQIHTFGCQAIRYYCSLELRIRRFNNPIIGIKHS